MTKEQRRQRIEFAANDLLMASRKLDDATSMLYFNKRYKETSLRLANEAWRLRKKITGGK